MTLLLSESEARELDIALEIYLDQLHREVAHTDKREYKAALKSRLTALEAVKQRLDGLMPQLPAEA